MENRIIALEEKFYHLEKFVDELNNVVIDQYKLIDKQKEEIEKLKQIATSGSNSEEIKNEPPPHY